MNLYLASYAKVTMDKIADHFGFADLSNKKAVFIPTAADPYEDKGFVEEDRYALEKLGCEVEVLDVKNADLDELAQTIDPANILLMAGGNTFYLMDQLIRSGADEIIKNFIINDGIYIGSSAGSIICCPTIEGAEEFDDPGLAPDLTGFNGLNVFPNIVIPHVHKEKYFERVRRATEKLEKQGFKVYCLTDDDVVFYDGEKITEL